MALTLGSLSSRGSICSRCLLTMSSVARNKSASYIQARAYSSKQWSKYGEKVKRKNQEWDERARLVQAGKIQNTWDFFEERGFVKDTAGTREHIRELMRRKRIGAYVGIDPTAASLHVGHLLPLMPLFWLYLNGYAAYSLLGGATVKVGDPTDRLVSRDPIPKADLAMNMTKIHYQLRALWMNVEERGRTNGFQKEWAWKRGLVNNNTWWNKVPMLEVLKVIGNSVRLGPMLSRDTVKNKMSKGDGMSFAEFTYPLMQGWDWWHLYDRNEVQMQIGGSDQYGNIVTGTDIIKIARENTAHYPEARPYKDEYDDPVGFTVPLLTDSAGVKFGKSAGNAVWLDRFMTSEFDLYGYFVRRPDEDIERLLKLFTFLPTETIKKVMEEQALDPGKRIAHHLLAYEVVALVHGVETARETQAAHKQMYGRPAIQLETTAREPAKEGEENKQITWKNAPKPDIELPESLIRGKSIARILYASGLVKSVSEGNRVATQQGIYIGGAPGKYQKREAREMNAAELKFTPVRLWAPEQTADFLIDGKILILRKGKHNIRIIKVVPDDEYKASRQTYPGMPFTGQVRTLITQIKALRRGDTKPEEVASEIVEREKAADRGPGQTLKEAEKEKERGKTVEEMDEELAEEVEKVLESEKEDKKE
ncbi:tRNA synthetases class I-domain-containing protein [Podospora australis]|uniref:Tyrosine--tRNA ligase n=1 Tax=Podospora australis TaxID=1536484 RepID=A0AAN7ANG5_9PEZI|nr:tRNA synthetases class I-domain-containing protein [Podospora australis]